jgi:2-C-methyl-D-erythritol 4-phosphate cytidylyltransferase
MHQAAVIIPAAGQGQRLPESSAPKQFLNLGGVPVFIWSLATFLQHPRINQAVLVVPENWSDKTKELLEQHLPELCSRVTVITGGATRQESVYSGLEKLLEQSPQYVFIHDAARPFVTAAAINDLLTILEKGFACTLAIPLSDSIREIKDAFIVKEMDRNSLALMQTPQAAHFKSMLDAHRAAKAKGYETTDDAALIKAHGMRTVIVPGSRLNIKITQWEDLYLAKALIENFHWSPGLIDTNLEQTLTVS